MKELFIKAFFHHLKSCFYEILPKLHLQRPLVTSPKFSSSGEPSRS